MSFPKSCVVGPDGVLFERPDQHVNFEDVHAHRSKRKIRRAGNWRRVVRLLLKTGNAIGVVDGDNAESWAVGDRNLDGGNRQRRLTLEVEPEHLRVVHLVDVIARQDDHVTGAFPDDRVEILIDRVGRPEIPVFAHALLRRQNLDELAQLFRHDVPAHPDVTVQRQRLVLRGNEDSGEDRN